MQSGVKFKVQLQPQGYIRAVMQTHSAFGKKKDFNVSMNFHLKVSEKTCFRFLQRAIMRTG